MADQPDFPQPESNDPEDVSWNLQTAGTMWSRGDAREAVRWLRRAAEAAGASGNDMRAVTLARAAADITTAMKIPPSIAPAAPEADDEHEEDEATPVPLAPRVPRGPVPEADWGDNERTIPERPAVEPPQGHTEPAGHTEQLQGHADQPQGHTDQPQGHTEPQTRSSSVAPGGAALRPRQALRVAVQPSPDERGLLLVRTLAEGESAPDGHHEALLVALEPGVHLLSKRR